MSELNPDEWDNWTEQDLNNWLSKIEREKQPFIDLGISSMTINALRRGGYTSVEQVAAASDFDLLALRQLGKKGLRDLRDAIPQQGQVDIPDIQWNHNLQRYTFDNGKEFYVMTRPLTTQEAAAAYAYWLEHKDEYD